MMSPRLIVELAKYHLARGEAKFSAGNTHCCSMVPTAPENFCEFKFLRNDAHRQHEYGQGQDDRELSFHPLVRNMG